MLALPSAPVECSPNLLSARQIAQRLSISVRTVWRMLERGELPEPIRYNRKLVRWRATDFEHYVETLTAGVRMN